MCAVTLHIAEQEDSIYIDLVVVQVVQSQPRVRRVVNVSVDQLSNVRQDAVLWVQRHKCEARSEDRRNSVVSQ